MVPALAGAESSSTTQELPQKKVQKYREKIIFTHPYPLAGMRFPFSEHACAFYIVPKAPSCLKIFQMGRHPLSSNPSAIFD